MHRSLRFRLPALFLVGIVVSGVIAAAIALALFQSYAHKQLLVKLRREANGLTELYQRQAIAANNTGATTIPAASPNSVAPSKRAAARPRSAWSLAVTIAM